MDHIKDRARLISLLMEDAFSCGNPFANLSSTLSAWELYFMPRTFDTIGLKGSNLVGVEVGVFRGGHAADLLNRGNLVKKLHLVDSYTPYSEDNLTPILARAEQIAHARLKATGKEVVWHRKSSQEAAWDFPEQVDFVYIDAEHTYEAVYRDIRDWYGHVKKGGIIGGHDYSTGWSGVVRAVDEWAAENKLVVHHQHPDWWVEVC